MGELNIQYRRFILMKISELFETGRAMERYLQKKKSSNHGDQKLICMTRYDSKEMASSEVFLTVKALGEEYWIIVTHN